MSGRLADRIAELSTLLDGTSISVLSLTEDGETLTLRRDPAPAPAPAPALPSALKVPAPCAGVFLASHPLGGDALAQPGQAVAAGAVLGLLRIGPLLVEVPAPTAGMVLSVDAIDGALLGYGAALVHLLPSSPPDLIRGSTVPQHAPSGAMDPRIRSGGDGNTKGDAP